MSEITTTVGSVYVVSSCGKVAWPKWNPCRPWELLEFYSALGQGVMVCASLPADDYRVTHAGREWREVYELLNCSLEVE